MPQQNARKNQFVCLWLLKKHFHPWKKFSNWEKQNYRCFVILGKTGNCIASRPFFTIVAFCVLMGCVFSIFYLPEMKNNAGSWHINCAFSMHDKAEQDDDKQHG